MSETPPASTPDSDNSPSNERDVSDESQDGEKEESKSGRTPPSISLYIGNIAYETTEEELQNEFSRVGIVISAKVARNNARKKSLGYAFLEVPDKDIGQKMIDAYDNKEFGRRTLKVEFATGKRRRRNPPMRRGYHDRDHGRGRDRDHSSRHDHYGRRRSHYSDDYDYDDSPPPRRSRRERSPRRRDDYDDYAKSSRRRRSHYD